MDFETWKETFEDKLKDDHDKSGTNKEFDSWCSDIWAGRMAEIEIEAYEYENNH